MEGGKGKGTNGSHGCAAERLGMQRNSDQISVRDRVGKPGKPHFWLPASPSVCFQINQRISPLQSTPAMMVFPMGSASAND